MFYESSKGPYVNNELFTIKRKKKKKLKRRLYPVGVRSSVYNHIIDRTYYDDPYVRDNPLVP